VLCKLKRYDEAEAALKKALSKNANFARAHTTLASVYYEQRRIEEGHRHVAAVLELEPADPNARKLLGLLYASLGRLDEAAVIFREWLEHEPTSEQARHHLAACAGGAAPDRATAGYVEEVFDSFAGSFDAKLAALEYRAPQLVGEAVACVLGEARQDLQILDLGCGTGLCGSYLRGYAQSLVGIDLSGNMLERARARGYYTSLIKADLVVYLRTCDSSHDVIVCADTLCYFGRLDEMVKSTRASLRRGGYFVFTVEAHESPDEFRLNPNGRYSHAEFYIRDLLKKTEFRVLSLSTDQLRTEGGKPVNGWIVTAQAA
jgi:predicted TPR repeat methyltransferase